MKLLNFLFGWVKQTDTQEVITTDIIEDNFYEWSQQPYDIHSLCYEYCL